MGSRIASTWTRRLALGLASAALLALSQAHLSLWPVAAVALVPWLFVSRTASTLEAVALGALVGTAFGCGVVSWIPEALRALGSSPGTAFAGLVVTAAWAKGPLFAWAGGIAHLLRKAPAFYQVVGVGAAFGVGEGLLSIWSGGVPAAFVGHSQLAASGVAQLAVVGGVPLISAWLVALNTAIALAAAGRPEARSLAVALAASWLGLAGLGMPLAEWSRPAPPPGPDVALLLVQPEIPRHARWDADAQPWILETVGAFTAAALAETGDRVDAVVWPENLLTSSLEADPELASELEREVGRWGVPLITGLVRAPNGTAPHEYRSSVVWLEPGRGLVAAVDKLRAVPLLESAQVLPGARWLAPLFGAAARWPKVQEATGAGGPLAGRFSVATALCYEVLFPRIVAARRTPESIAILNLADDSWVEGPRATRQLTQWAAFRAIEQRLPLVRVAHGGLSAVIDPYGRIVEELPLDRNASLRVALEPSAPPTASERILVFALPTTILVVVWWLGEFAVRWGRRSLGARRSR